MAKIFNGKRKLTPVAVFVAAAMVVSTGMAARTSTARMAYAAETSQNCIVPKPASYEEGEGNFVLTQNSSIYVKGNGSKETKEIKKIAQILRKELNASTGFELNIVEGEDAPEGSIYLTTIRGNEEDGDEGYEIKTTDKNIKVIAYKPEGISRGIQTLKQLFPADIEKENLVNDVEWKATASTIKDKPEYGYRGIMIDVARHFFSVDEIERQIDHAADYKINTVHLHLSDDQGWRLEIKKYPDLTLIGGSTAVNGDKGGYYTQEDFKEIVKYAADRYIDIIPEFDMPGHTNAALASYGFLNPDGQKKELYTGIDVGFSTLNIHDEKTYEFIDDVYNEVSKISPSKYIGIGGDEASVVKTEDYNYFVGRVNRIAEKYNKTPIGWDPIDTVPEIDQQAVLQNWKDSNEEATNKGMSMIISIAHNCYLDMKYDENSPYGLKWAGYIPIEKAYNWDPTDFARRDLILGVESPLWSETINDSDGMDYLMYPRLLGYSEIGWTAKADRDWNEYKGRLEQQGERLENKGINYYKDSSIWQN